MMVKIRYVQASDETFWYKLDKHLPKAEFLEKVRTKRGYGKMLMTFWEKEMAKRGYGMVLTSTQVDETAQHFYRKLGYKDCGGLIIDIPGYAQPMEMFLSKEIAACGDVSVIQ